MHSQGHDQGVIKVTPGGLAVIFMQRFDMTVTLRSDFEPDDYRAATNLAIFYVALLLDRLIHQNTDGFTAIRAIDVRFQ